MTNRRELADRLEAAECGSSALDAAIFKEFGCPMPSGFMGISVDLEWQEDGSALFPIGGMGVRYSPPAFTTSLDAALALAERVLPGWNWCVARDAGATDQTRYRAWVISEADRKANPLGGSSQPAPTAPLALCAAILRARLDDEGKGLPETPEGPVA